ncbi:thioredoxin domain protein [Halobacteriovorax sp. BALOs_7]|uniref:thioredoxin family protein n=1 Tax=Halobacteriovorax sp. BALOs_7 TaxID=2109558 RepID=UPI000EB6AF78|nr:thioredoxin family protein [Halobacteriovorax sp. BALOs_7]AYF44565.1 thioredoxin domain protein [Halobacteriovorax sp. BALOs_7]
MNIKKINNENFESVVSSEKNVFVIKFYSDTCGPCKTMAPVFEALNNNNPDVNVYEVNTIESPEIADQFGVRGVPYTAICENREVLYDFTGLTPLGKIQYVINNINDSHFRLTGEFKAAETKKNYFFQAIVISLLAVFALAIFFAG